MCFADFPQTTDEENGDLPRSVKQQNDLQKTENKVMSNIETKIDKREDVNPETGEHKYGDVEFADPTNNKYPIDTPEHIRAAHRYINHKDNAAKYEADEVELIKKRIKQAAEKHGVEISAD